MDFKYISPLQCLYTCKKLAVSYTLGLDVSTSITGVCLVDPEIPVDDKGSHIVELSHIDFKKCGTFFAKADLVKTFLEDLKARHDISSLRSFALEEPLLGFQKGMSSAATITTLMRFNGIVSYIGRGVFGIDPTYISSASARKLCGIKMQRTSVAGMSGKEQVFKHMSEHDLKHVVWATKKNGLPIDASRDMTDAYVIARAASIL
jgi:hypothetical protein